MLDLVVAESERKQGMGGRLLAAIEPWARDRGVWRIEVGVVCSSNAAVSFYSNRGFVAFSQRMGKELLPEWGATAMGWVPPILERKFGACSA